MTKAAILAAKGFGQEGIAQALGVSQTTVSRWLKDALNAGILDYPLPCLRRENIDQELLVRAEDAISFARLSDELRPRLNALAGGEFVRTISIVRTSSEKTGEDDWLLRLKAVCQLAARDLPDMLSRASAVGVAWGQTLHFLLEELRERPPRIKTPPTIFPIVGSFPYTEKPYPLALTSTRIAAGFAEILHGVIPTDQIGLAAIPAFIPAEIERGPIEKFFSMLPGYREVFGDPGVRGSVEDPNALLNSADFLVTGMGDMPSKEGGSPLLRERLRHEAASLEEWSNMSPGDIGGVLLPRHGVPKEQSKKITDINRRFIGIGLRDYRRCAQCCLTSQGAKPGVVVIAHDRSKAAAVMEAVRNQCINHLFIDADLATQLQDLLKAELQVS